MTLIRIFFLFLFILFSNTISSQNFHILDVLLEDGEFQKYISPATPGNEVEDFNDPLNLFLFENYDQGKMLFYGLTKRNLSAQTYEPIILLVDENKKVIRKKYYDRNNCADKIVYMKVSGGDLILISATLEVYHLPDFESNPMDICNNFVFQLGAGNYTVESRPFDYTLISSFLTISTNVTDRTDTRGVLQTVINLSSMELLNDFFIPAPNQESFGTAFCYLDSETLATSFVDFSRLGTNSRIYLADRQRRITDSIPLDEYHVRDMKKFNSDELLVCGSTRSHCVEDTTGWTPWVNCDEHAQLMKLNRKGELLWENETISDPFSYYKDVELSTDGHIYLHGYYNADSTDSYLVGTNLDPVIVRKFSMQGQMLSDLHIGNWTYNYSSQQFGLDAEGRPMLLSNFGHTGTDVAYLHTYYSSLGTSVTDYRAEMDLLKLTPNPTSDRLAISSPSGLGKPRYQLYNTEGKLLAKGRVDNEIDLAAFQSGVYLVQIIGQGWSKTRRVVKI